MLWSITEALSLLFLLEWLFQVHIYLFIAVAYFVILLSDSVDKETADPIKIAIVTGLSALILFTSLDSGSVIQDTFPNGENGDSTLAMAGDFRIATSALALLTGLTIVYFMAKIHWHAPKNLKKYTRLNLLGAIFLGILSSLAVGSGLTLIIPGIASAFISSGALLMAIAFVSQPKIGYVLPFKAERLTVIDIDSGIPLFTHTWNKKEEMLDDVLFSGMIGGLSHFTTEALRKGDIREVHLDQAILILERHKEHPVFFVLVTSNPSPSLRSALTSFAEKFSKEFSFVVLDTDAYEAASNIILTCFPFVPEYD
ncbi:MAG: hypothetical protein ACXACI_01570 [Candidatus Hodarchaeales archaeon]